ncbi:MAG: D-hexose-6-phosphate mutarotase [Pirellulaceae bacterium]
MSHRIVPLTNVTCCYKSIVCVRAGSTYSRWRKPICFSWFAANQSDPQAPAHGTARISLWELQNVQLAEDHQSVAFTFGLALPPFRLLYEVEFGTALKIRLTVTNTSDQTQTFEAALHSYFSLSHIKQVEVLGLQKARFLDQLSGTMYPPTEQPIRFTQETDRIYYDTTDAIQIVDSGWGRRIQIEKFGSPSTVVWNPWIEKSQRMSDFGDNEWPHMCCIETAAIRQNRIELPPDESHTIGTTHAVSHI